MRITIISAFIISLIFLLKINVLITVAVIAVVFAVVILVYIPLYIKSYEIIVYNDSIIINNGVFIKSSHIMPFSRLVYAQFLKTPIAAKMGLSAAALKAARGWLFLPETKTHIAQEIIKNITGEDAL